ncbi:DsbA family protein, partial [Escherichia coli]
RMEYRAQELRRWSQHLGMALNPKPAFWPVNPAPSSYAIIAAQEAGGGDLAGLVQGFLRAVWAEDADIADDAVIRRTLAAAG